MILLLAGTGDGRLLLAGLKKDGYQVIAAAATPYGGELLEMTARTIARPLDKDDLLALIKSEGITALVDATHPFARRASENAISACRETGVSYLRFEREKVRIPDHPLIHRCRDFPEAARKAAAFGEVLFLTTGSKTLELFLAEARKTGKRVVARVLPDPEVMARCFALGLRPPDIIAMQGPFSYQLNKALLAEYQATVLVTKESGSAGGTDTKVKAALALGIPVVLIQRPEVEYGLVVHDYQGLRAALRSGGEHPRNEVEGGGF
ncbi:MAG: precorrin-6A reductase [Firmicutes bacterium]|nr:precorrin-6A reductase [Bacillota bacterium]